MGAAYPGQELGPGGGVGRGAGLPDGIGRASWTSRSAPSPQGGIWVFFGSPYGIHAAPDQVLGEGQPRFGQEVAPAGDVNGDGFVDLAVSGTPAADAIGSPSTLAAPQILTEGTTLNGRATNSSYAAGNSGLVARAMSTAGDENGDGYADLLAGDQARGHLFRGGRTGINPTKCPTSSCPTDSFSRAAPTSTATASPTLSRPTRSAEPAPGSSR